MLCFFSYSFTVSDGSEESTAGRVVSTCSIMMHHGLRSKEARRARKKKYRLRQTISHSSLLVARQGDVSCKLNQAFLLVDSFNFYFAYDERSDIHNCLCTFLNHECQSYVQPSPMSMIGTLQLNSGTACKVQGNGFDPSYGVPDSWTGK